MTIGAFPTDGDLGHGTVHEAQDTLNMTAFRRDHDVSMAQHFLGLSDPLHLLKRAVPNVEENCNGGGGSRNRHSPTEPRKVD
jgi:hypothetical protein